MERQIKIWWVVSAFIINTVLTTSILTLQINSFILNPLFQVIISPYLIYTVSATWPILLIQVFLLTANAEGFYYLIAVLNTIIQVYIWIATIGFLHGLTVIYVVPLTTWVMQILGLIGLGIKKCISDDSNKYQPATDDL